MTDNLFVAYKPLISFKSCPTSYHQIFYAVETIGLS